VFWDHDKKQWLMIVKNTSAAALNPKRVVMWEVSDSYEVQQATTMANGPNVAGIVDPEIAGTVPVNKHFYIVQKGICTVAKGTSPIAVISLSPLMVHGGAVSAGKVGAVSAALSPTMSADILRAALYPFAISHDAASAALLTDLQCMIDVRGA
jgi:hypothetical protein